MALFQELLGCGSMWSVVQLDYDEELGLLHGMYCSVRHNTAHHQKGGVDDLPLSAQESDWTHQGACRQRKELLMGYGEERGNAQGQKEEMQICGSKFGKNCKCMLQLE